MSPATTVAPLIGLPLPSFAVTVIVLPVPPAVIGFGDAVTVESVADTDPAVPVAVNVTGLPIKVPEAAVSVFVPAVEPSVHEVSWARPLAVVVSVAGDAGDIVPPPPVTVKTTLTPLTGLPFASVTFTDGATDTAGPRPPSVHCLRARRRSGSLSLPGPWR